MAGATYRLRSLWKAFSLWRPWQKNSLACSGALKYQCWNGTSINSEKAGKKIITAIEKELSSLKDFDKVLLKEIEKELKNSKSTVSQRQGKLQTQQDANTKQMKNIIAAIGDSGHSASLLAELKTLEATKAQLANELSSILTTSTSIPKMPSMEEIKLWCWEACALSQLILRSLADY